MESLKKSNGSRNPAGTLTARGSAFKTATPTLPSFVSRSYARAADRPGAACARLKSWQHLETDEVIRRGAAAAAQTHAGSRVSRLGNLALTAFVLLAIGMGAYAIHQEQRLAPHERQLLQQQR